MNGVSLPSAAVRVPSALRVVWAEGPDAVSFLQGILSQDVAGVAPGSTSRSLLLAPQGKLVAILWLLRGEGRVGLLADQAPETVVDSLATYRIRVKVDFEIDRRPVTEIWGPGAAAVAGIEPSSWADEPPAVRASIDHAGFERVAWIGDVVVDEAARLTEVGSEEAEAYRIMLGEPRFGVDIDRGTIPQESGLVPSSVSFTKGCFLGQELVARIDSRGHVNRHLRIVRSEAPVEAGATVHLGDRDVGRVTSATDRTTPALALAMLRREAAPGSTVRIEASAGSIAGTVVPLPANSP